MDQLVFLNDIDVGWWPSLAALAAVWLAHLGAQHARKVYGHYGQIIAHCGLTGHATAKRLLEASGLSHLSVIRTSRPDQYHAGRHEIQLNSEDDTRALGRRLAQCLPSQCVVALNGTLGAGKTRLVRAFAEALDELDLSETTPMAALNILWEWKQTLAAGEGGETGWRRHTGRRGIGVRPCGRSWRRDRHRRRACRAADRSCLAAADRHGRSR